MKTTLPVLFFVYVFNFSFSQPLSDTIIDKKFLAENEISNLNRKSQEAIINNLLDDNGFKFNLKATKINSKYSEVPSGFFKDHLIIVSSKKIGSINKKGINNEPNSNLFHLKIKKGGGLSKPLIFAKFLNSILDEGQIAFTKNNKIIYFTRVNDITKNFQLYKITFDEKNKSWNKPTKIRFSNSNFSIETPFVKDNKLYFSSNMTEGNYGGYDLYVSLIHPNGSLGKPVNLGANINTASNEKYPFIDNDKNYFYFSSDKVDSYGGFDVFRSRMHPNNFKTPINLGKSINSEHDEIGFLLKNDTNGYLASNNISKDNFDIFSFDLLPVTQILKGEIINSKSNEPVSNVTINLYDEYDRLVNSQKTDSFGHYSFNVLPLDTYTIEVIKEGYQNLNKTFNADQTFNTTYLVNLEVEKELEGSKTSSNAQKNISNSSLTYNKEKEKQSDSIPVMKSQRKPIKKNSNFFGNISPKKEIH